MTYRFNLQSGSSSGDKLFPNNFAKLTLNSTVLFPAQQGQNPGYATVADLLTFILTNPTIFGLIIESSTDTIVANPGGGQTNATAFTSEVNRVTTVATAGDSVKLPPAVAGLTIFSINHGAASMQVYGTGTDTIDDVATATGVSQMVNSMVVYTCTTNGKWYSNGLGTGYAGQYPTVSYANGLVAHAGGGQASATPITTCIARFTTVATLNDSAIMPPSAGGMQITVNNAGAASMNLFPAVGEQINALGVNVAFAVAAGKSAIISCAASSQWHAVLSA